VEVRSSDELGTRPYPEATGVTTAKDTPPRLACGAHWLECAQASRRRSVAVPSVWPTTTPLIWEDAPARQGCTTQGRRICGVGVHGLSNTFTRREAALIVVAAVRAGTIRLQAALAYCLL
jgi:hypothetical protein